MIINIKVKTSSNKQEIKKISNNNYTALLKNPAQDNKANLELLKILKKHFKKDIKIIKGLKSKNKVIKIKNAN